jgi:hypothetical protein
MPLKSTQATHAANRGLNNKINLAGCILQYDFQNPSCYNGGNTVTDLRGNSAATVYNTPTWNTTDSRYLNFDGPTSSNQYLMTTTSLNSRLSPANTGVNISVFIWVYPSSNGVIVSERGMASLISGWHDSQIEIVAGKVCFGVWLYTSGNPQITGPTISLNTWNYLGFTYNGTTLTGYVNGVSVGAYTISRLSPYNGSTQGLHYALCAEDTTNLGAGGYSASRVGAFHVYNRGLTATEVFQNYTNTKRAYGI